MANEGICLFENFLDAKPCKQLVKAFENVIKFDKLNQRGWISNFSLNNDFVIRREMSAYVFHQAGEKSAFKLLTDLRKRILEQVGKYYDGIKLYPEFTLLTNNCIGDYHSLHADSERYVDGNWIPNHTPQRTYTGMLYLNTGGGVDFNGGELDFPKLNCTIVPKEGLLVGFATNHNYVHQVFPVQSGQRFAISLWMTENKLSGEYWHE